MEGQGGAPVDQLHLRAAFHRLDADHSRAIDFHEYLQMLQPKVILAALIAHCWLYTRPSILSVCPRYAILASLRIRHHSPLTSPPISTKPLACAPAHPSCAE